MLNLHYYPDNASLAPLILLEELGVPYELTFVDRDRQVHHSVQYLRLNPNGLIPVLVDDCGAVELVLYEAAAICLHLVDSNPLAGLAPALGTVERAHFYKWLIWLTNTLQATLMVHFYPEKWAATPAAITQVRQHAQVRIGPLLDQLDAQLAGHGCEWMLGARYSAVDPYALMLCKWTHGLAHAAHELPHLGAYLRRVAERPATRRALVLDVHPAPKN
jgi:glutathione S-transferase